MRPPQLSDPITTGLIALRLDRWVVCTALDPDGVRVWVVWPPRIFAQEYGPAHGGARLFREGWRTAFDWAHDMATTHPWSVVK